MRKKTILSILLLTIFITSIFSLASVSATTITVGSGKDYATITLALASAVDGDVIEVYAGTYIEDLSITVPNLELVAVETATIKGVVTGHTSTFPAIPANIWMNADSVELHGFRIESPAVAVDYISGGIIVNGTGVEIYDNDFVSYAIGTGENVAIQSLHKDNGGDVSGLYIHDNTFSGTPASGYLGIYVNPDLDSSNYVTIEDNDLSGYLCQGIITERDRTRVLNNDIMTDQVNTIYGNGVGVYRFDALQTDVIVWGNDIRGSGTGLGFRRGIFTGLPAGFGQTFIILTGNTVEDCDWGVLVRTSPANVEVHYNNLENNNVDLENTATGIVDATLNWWGDVSATSPYPNMVGSVDVYPWLTTPYAEDLTGPMGPQGPTGPEGDRGSRGLTGSQGPTGLQGEQGETGLTGEAGSDGTQGSIGDAGPQGIQGVAGETGPQGATGDAGPQGIAGEAGSQGPKGEQGDTGAVGPKGAEGEPAPASVAYGGAALGTVSLLGLLYMFFRAKP